MAGRLYRMAKVVSANPSNWGVVDANEISGFRQVSAVADLYNIAECILSSTYGDGKTDGTDAVGQIWHVTGTNEDYRLTNWANRKSASGWTKVTYGGDVDVPVKSAVQSTGAGEVNILSGTKITVDAYTKKEVEATYNRLTAECQDLGKNVSTLKELTSAHTTEISDISTKLNSIDQTLFEVVTELPKTTATIKKHIYLVKGTGSTGNVYDEWIYTGDLSATYDSTKWEKFGTVETDVNVGNAIKTVTATASGATGFSLSTATINGTNANSTITYPVLKGATSSAAGTQGLVPAPASGNNTAFLRGDGTWAVPTNTDTHYTTHLYVGEAGSAANTSAANGKVCLKLYDNNTARESHLIKGTGATTVESDSNGNITINSTNTTYSNATIIADGLMSKEDKKIINDLTQKGLSTGLIVGVNGNNVGSSGLSFYSSETEGGYLYSVLDASDDVTTLQLLILGGFDNITDGKYPEEKVQKYMDDYGTSGVIIDSPYVLNDISISGNTLTITKGDQSTSTITLPSYGIATNTTAGLLKPTLYYNGTVKFNTASISVERAAVVNEATDVSGRYYAVASDTKGQPFVNVPWVDTNTKVLRLEASDGADSVNLIVYSSDNSSTSTKVCNKLTESEILAILN